MSGQQRRPGLARLAPTPTDTTPPAPGFPWADGDVLYADHLNGAFIPVSGGQMLGPLTLAADAAQPLQPVSLQQMNTTVGGVANVKNFGAIGDGMTDNTAALTAAIATGLPVYLPPGTYLTGPLIVAQSMRGAGNVSILKANASASWPQYSAVVTQNAASGAIISDLVIDGSSLAQRGIYLPGTNAQQTGLRFERLEIMYLGTPGVTDLLFRSDGILVEALTTNLASKQGIVIHDCYIHDMVGGTGMFISGMGFIISDNTIMNCASCGIGIGVGIDGVISNNTIYNTGTNSAPGIIADGITGYDHRNLRMLIIGNTVNTSGNHGTHFGGNFIQIIGNKFYNIHSNGIILQSDPNIAPTPSADGVISDNQISAVVTGGGIIVGYFSRVSVTGNNIVSAYSRAVELISSDHSVVSGNVIDTTVVDYGVYTKQSNYALVIGNCFYNTHLQSIFDDTPASTGLQVFDNVIDGEGAVSNVDRTINAPGSGAVTITSPTSVGTAAAPDNLTVNGGMTVGNNTYNTPTLIMNGMTGTSRIMSFSTGGSLRWRIYGANGTAEGGSNVGSDFSITRYTDAGVSISSPLLITRSTGLVTVGSGLAVSGNTGFNGTTPIAKPTVTGAKGSNAALASLMTALAAYGLVTDSTTA